MIARPFREPYDWEAFLGFLSSRTIGGVEEIENACYRRAVRIDGIDGWIEIARAPRRKALLVQLAPSLEAVQDAALARIDHAMDLAVDPHEILRALGPLASARPGLRVPGAFDGFEIAVRAVLGQQISVKAARTLARRFAAAFGRPIETPFAGITHTFPLPQTIAAIDPQRIIELGILSARAATIVALARALASGALQLTPGTDVAPTLVALQEIRGIGVWTAQYIAMRALDDTDAFPHSDLGVIKALGERNPKRILAIAEAWRPWRAYAVMHLWHTCL
jgi:AraC family transcriptional regulator of adaptative response / DNA-3-methyladenine glycosylase II